MTDALFGFGGSPSDVVTDPAGNALPGWPVQVLIPATGQIVTDLVEADGTTPIPLPLLTDPAGSGTPGRIRRFKSSARAVAFRTWDVNGQLLPQWTQVSPDAYTPVTNALPLSGGTITGDLIVDGALSNPGGRRWQVAGLGPTGGDTQPSIQAAVDAAYSAGGGVVEVSGFCQMAGAISLRTGVVLDARKATLQAITTHHLVNNYASGQNLGGYTGHGNIVILGGVWDANALDPSTGVGVNTGSNIMTFSHGYRISVIGATFLNVAVDHALEFNAIDGGLADSCYFYGYIDSTDAQNRQKAEAIQIDGAIPDGGVAPPQDDTVARNITIRNCESRASDRLGPWGCLVGSHSNFLNLCDNITVDNCRAYGALLAGVHAHGWTHSRVVNSYFEDCPTAVLVDLTARQNANCEALQVRGNTMVGCGNTGTDGAAIQFAGNTGTTYKHLDPMVSGNTIRASVGHAIVTSSTVGAMVGQNIIDGYSGAAINPDTSDQLTIDGNQISNGATANAMYIESTCSNVIVQNNILTASSTNTGIVVSGANGTRVRSNTIRKGSSAQSTGISVSSGTTGCVVIGNDLSGNGWDNSALNLASGTATFFSGSYGIPGNNLVS